MPVLDAPPRPASPIRNLYDWMMRNATGRHAWVALAGFTFAEASFFPIPTDIMLIPMALADRRRAFLLGGFAGLGMLALGGRLAHLQLIETQRYEKLSASNQFNFKLTPPPRGLIVDRNGVVLASNRPNFLRPPRFR